MKIRHLLFTCLLLSLGIAACGDSGDSANEEAQIRSAIEQVVGDPKPANCRRLQTQRYLEQTKRSTGKTALEYCEEEAKDESGEAVEVSHVSIDGSKARARATYIRGPLAGFTLLLGLIESGERWKLDEAIRWLNFDKEKVLVVLEDSLIESSEGSNPKAAACISAELERVSTRRLERVFLSAPKIEVLFLQVAKSCVRAAGPGLTG